MFIAEVWESGDNLPAGRSPTVVLPQFGRGLRQSTLISSAVALLYDDRNGFFIRRVPTIFHVTILAVRERPVIGKFALLPVSLKNHCP